MGDDLKKSWCTRHQSSWYHPPCRWMFSHSSNYELIGNLSISQHLHFFLSFTCRRQLSIKIVIHVSLLHTFMASATGQVSIFYANVYWRWVTQTIWTLWKAITHGRSRSTLALVMAWCLMSSSHHQDQCWLIIHGILLHSSRCSIKEALKISIH